HWLGCFGGTGRHVRSHHRQDKPGPAHSFARPGTAKEACSARQLYESDVARRSHRLRSQAAADMAADPRRHRQKRAMKAAQGVEARKTVHIKRLITLAP